MDVVLYGPDHSKPAHFCLIRDINRFTSILSPGTVKCRHLCRRCGKSIVRADDYEVHKLKCEQQEPEDVVEILPKKQFFTFSSHSRTMKIPMLIYGDFECFIEGPNRFSCGRKMRTCF